MLVAMTGLLAAATFSGRDAWTIESGKLRLTILQSGGHVAQLLLKEEGGISPLWVQSRPTMDPENYHADRDGTKYGGGAGARLMSGLAGHNVCFPYWGNPSPDEERAGMTFHGETGVARWKRTDGGTDWITVAAELPESRTRFVRTVRVRGQVAYFEETAENESAWDRPVGWCEHVTLGPPFLEKGVTLLDASVTRGRALNDRSGKEITWSGDLRTVRNVERSAGFVDNFLVDPAREMGWFTALHPGKRLLVGYVFRRRDFPWLNVWEANNRDMLTRGMEFSNTPVHGTMRALVEQPELWGVPAFDWLAGKGRLQKKYLAFSVRVPDGFQGVKDVQVERGKLLVREAGGGRELAIDITEGL